MDEKIFGVGLPKTGLTSLVAAMRLLGYKSSGRQYKLSALFFKERYNDILKVYDEYDFLVDHPTFLMYKLAFERYGKRSKYILTLRKDPQTWFESLKRHQRYAHPIRNKHHRTFGRFYPHGFDAEHIAYYESHQEEVIRFFKENGALDRLLVICVEEPKSFQKLIEFLEVETEMTKFPHENKSVIRTPSLSNRFKLRYNGIIQPLYEKVMPILRPAKPEQAMPREITKDQK